MSASREVTIHCDCCCQWDDSGYARTLIEALRQARAAGWHRINPGVDLCPFCWATGHRPPWTQGRCIEARQQGSNDGQSDTSLADGPSTLPEPTIGAL